MFLLSSGQRISSAASRVTLKPATLAPSPPPDFPPAAFPFVERASCHSIHLQLWLGEQLLKFLINPKGGCLQLLSHAVCLSVVRMEDSVKWTPANHFNTLFRWRKPTDSNVGFFSWLHFLLHKSTKQELKWKVFNVITCDWLIYLCICLFIHLFISCHMI